MIAPTPSTPLPQAGYPATAADRHEMLAGAQSLRAASTIAAYASHASARNVDLTAVIEQVAAGYAAGLRAIDNHRLRYTEPKPEWIEWEQQARAGWSLVQEAGTASTLDPAVAADTLRQIGIRAHAGSALLTAWTG